MLPLRKRGELKWESSALIEILRTPAYFDDDWVAAGRTAKVCPESVRLSVGELAPSAEFLGPGLLRWRSWPPGPEAAPSWNQPRVGRPAEPFEGCSLGTSVRPFRHSHRSPTALRHSRPPPDRSQSPRSSRTWGAGRADCTNRMATPVPRHRGFDSCVSAAEPSRRAHLQSSQKPRLCNS